MAKVIKILVNQRIKIYFVDEKFSTMSVENYEITCGRHTKMIVFYTQLHDFPSCIVEMRAFLTYFSNHYPHSYFMIIYPPRLIHHIQKMWITI